MILAPAEAVRSTKNVADKIIRLEMRDSRYEGLGRALELPVAHYQNTRRF